MKEYRYDKRGLLAIDPKAFLEMYYVEEDVEKPPFALVGDVAIVAISGPLDHHAGWFCDNYDDILVRLDKALASAAKNVVLKIDSVGGAVSGCFSTARAMRARADASGKPLVAYVEGHAASAAYALACSAKAIFVAETAILGSIGILDTRVDVTAADAKEGVKYSYVASGKHKTDGYAHVPLSESELEERQTIVDHMAEVFFTLVRDLRGVDPAPLEARQFCGQAAVGAKLADGVMTYEGLLAQLASGELNMTELDKARSALEEAAKGDGEEAELAKKALKALTKEQQDEKEECDDEENPSDSDTPPKQEDDDEDAAAGTTEKAAHAASTAGSAGDLAALVQQLSAKVTSLEQQTESAQRNEILASRPDIAPELRKLLRTKPLAEVKQLVAAIPKPATKKSATAAVTGTRGEGQDSDGSTARLPPQESDALRQRMGLVAMTTGVKNEGNKLTLGVAVPVKKGA